MAGKPRAKPRSHKRAKPKARRAGIKKGTKLKPRRAGHMAARRGATLMLYDDLGLSAHRKMTRGPRGRPKKGAKLHYCRLIAEKTGMTVPNVLHQLQRIHSDRDAFYAEVTAAKGSERLHRHAVAPDSETKQVIFKEKVRQILAIRTTRSSNRSLRWTTWTICSVWTICSPIRRSKTISL
eukprot:SAG11_NODE_303_length_11000_cov_7.979635_8_plen_180_part_00